MQERAIKPVMKRIDLDQVTTEKKENLRLCGGVFLTLCLQARRTRKSPKSSPYKEADGMSNPEFFEGLLRVAAPDFRLPEGSSYSAFTSKYKDCKNDSTPRDFPLSNDAVIDSFDRSVKEEYIEPLFRMSDFTDQFVGSIRPQVYRLVGALLEVIANDKTIGDNELFYIEPDGIAVRKADLKPNRLYKFQPFLLGVYHYIVTHRIPNSVGFDTIESWHEPAEQEHAQRRFVSSIGESFFPTDKFVTYHRVSSSNATFQRKEIAADYSATNSARFDFGPYLRKIKKSFAKFPCLILQGPCSFRKCYVCNDLYQERFYSIEREEFRTDFTFHNVTLAALIQKTSKYQLLTGTGGQGKSMMMRHLLLDAADNYETLGIVPFYIPLKDYNRTFDSLLDFTYLCISSLCTCTKEEYRHQLLNGNVLLLLDGLDEINAGLQEKFHMQLEDMINRYENNYYIMSSRPGDNIVAYPYFNFLRLQPLRKNQALEMVRKIPFSTEIKEKFCEYLEDELFETHKEFAENPLLLSIMLMTFHQIARIPSKMHYFYHEAYEALAVKHDATKGAFNRGFQTGLSKERLLDYLAEFGARTYIDQKLDLNDEDMDLYFRSLNERNRNPEERVALSDFIYDVEKHLCLMYQEGGIHYFVHRSFQEYFCALYFSHQKDKNLYEIAIALENRGEQAESDYTFGMLYDMIPQKIEEFVFLPYLKEIFDSADFSENYFRYLRKYHRNILCIDKAGIDACYQSNKPASIIIGTLMKSIDPDFDYSLPLVPMMGPSEIIENYGIFMTDDGENAVYGEPEKTNAEYADDVFHLHQIDVENAFSENEESAELRNLLLDDEFVLKKEFRALEDFYLKQVKNYESRSSAVSLFGKLD